MDENPHRIDEFKKEIADMRVRPPEDSAERVWLVAGLVLPLLGLGAIVLGWWGASGSAYPADQLPYVISGGLLGVGLIVAGAALFVRYSMTRYMRFWLLRIIYEERAQTDRTVETLERVEDLLRAATRPRAKADQS
jgi:hypothetical protein